MSDRHTQEQRSYNMSRIRSAGNRSTELRFIQILKNEKLSGWRRKFGLTGRPDFVFPKHHLVIFVDGCFWHGCHTCKQIPSSNRRYWLAKFARNRARDKTVTRELKKMGWHVMRILEHDLSTPSKWIWRLRSRLHSGDQ